jgi:hypothetical protein
MIESPVARMTSSSLVAPVAISVMSLLSPAATNCLIG